MARILILLVRGYRAIPRIGPPRCRFYPSCSAYAMDALRYHGVLVGGGLIVWRLARCHPFHPGGVDHVPARRRQATVDDDTADAVTWGEVNDPRHPVATPRS